MKTLIILALVLLGNTDAFSKEKKKCLRTAGETSTGKYRDITSNPDAVVDGKNVHYINCEVTGSKDCPPCPPTIGPNINSTDLLAASDLMNYALTQIGLGTLSGTHLGVYLNTETNTYTTYRVEWISGDSAGNNSTINFFEVIPD